MSKIDIEIHSSVYNEIFYPYLDDHTRTQIFYGGASSGKSVFLAQRCVRDLMKGNRNYLVVRQVGRTIRGSVFAEILRVISGWEVNELFNINKSDMLITCVNGYEIIFAGLDDIEKLKSLVPHKGAITDIWVEEATEVEQRSIKQLYKRQRGGDANIPKRLTMSFNPILQTHWIYEEYFSHINLADNQKEYKSDNLTILKTTYKDNRFLTDEDKRDLENETDKYFYNVYTLGNWGVLGHVIFTNWKVEDLSDRIAQFINYRNGLDFGFSADPAALFRSHYDSVHKIIYVWRELYETGLTNDKLSAAVKEIIGDETVTADSAEPKSIAECSMHGLNIRGAVKGKDSVLHGIQWLQQQTIVIDVTCVNTKNEFMQYHWKEDAGGNALPQPVEKNDHLISAGRYAYEGDSLGTWLIS